LHSEIGKVRPSPRLQPIGDWNIILGSGRLLIAGGEECDARPGAAADKQFDRPVMRQSVRLSRSTVPTPDTGPTILIEDPDMAAEAARHVAERDPHRTTGRKIGHTHATWQQDLPDDPAPGSGGRHQDQNRQPYVPCHLHNRLSQEQGSARATRKRLPTMPRRVPRSSMIEGMIEISLDEVGKISILKVAWGHSSTARRRRDSSG
jgi:hypothetical protein